MRRRRGGEGREGRELHQLQGVDRSALQRGAGCGGGGAKVCAGDRTPPEHSRVTECVAGCRAAKFSYMHGRM
eukprot:SAG31_NODE_169_length_21415_cov_29.765338_8_plen_72_part_00